MIVSTLLASRLFPGQDPIGQHVKPTPNDPWYTVLGVAADVKNSGLAGGGGTGVLPVASQQR